jgi:hypothetical protein
VAALNEPAERAPEIAARTAEPTEVTVPVECRRAAELQAVAQDPLFPARHRRPRLQGRPRDASLPPRAQGPRRRPRRGPARGDPLRAGEAREAPGCGRSGAGGEPPRAEREDHPRSLGRRRPPRRRVGRSSRPAASATGPRRVTISSESARSVNLSSAAAAPPPAPPGARHPRNPDGYPTLRPPPRHRPPTLLLDAPRSRAGAHAASDHARVARTAALLLDSSCDL